MARLPLHLNTRTITSHLFFGPYIFIPLIGGLTWLGGVLALLLLWVTDGKPRYRGDEASVVFVSDVGAVHHTLFIVIGSVTAGGYVLSLFAERWLRHIDRLPIDLRTREKIFDWLAIFFGIVGSAGLVLLTVFDTFNHSTIHWSMTLVFIVGIALSAIFQAGEVWSLHKDHPDRKSLLRNSVYKLIVVGAAVACAITFGATYAVCGGDATASKGRSAEECNRVTSVAAAFEWSVAFILVFFFFTLVADLWPAGKSSPRYMRRLARWQESHGEGDDFTGRRAFDEHPERWQDRYQGMKRAMWERNTGAEKVGRDSTASGAPMVGTGMNPASTGQTGNTTPVGEMYNAAPVPATHMGGQPAVAPAYPVPGTGASAPLGRPEYDAHQQQGYAPSQLNAQGEVHQPPSYPKRAHV